MKSILYIFLLITTFTYSQNDIRGRSCSGGLGLCNDIQIENSNRSNQNTTLMLVLPEHFFNEEQLVAIKSKNAKPQFFTIAQAVVFDTQSLSDHHLENDPGKIEAGTYPILFQDNKIQIEVTPIKD